MKKPPLTAWHNPEITSDMVKGARCELEGWKKLEESDHFPALEGLLKIVPSNLKKLGDVGFGAGEISRVFPDYEYTGFDLPHVIENVAMEVNPTGNYEKIDINQVDFDIFSGYDIILCNSFISELPNGEDILNSLFSVKPKYILLHRQEIADDTTRSENYKTYGNLMTPKCILSNQFFNEAISLSNFSPLQAFSIAPSLFSILFKRND